MEEITKPRFYLIQAGVQEFIAHIIDEQNVVDLATSELDGRSVTYITNIKKSFVNIQNIFQENVAPGQNKPSLQRMKGTILTLNVNNINNITVVPKELEDRLNAAIVGIIV